MFDYILGYLSTNEIEKVRLKVYKFYKKKYIPVMINSFWKKKIMIERI